MRIILFLLLLPFLGFSQTGSLNSTNICVGSGDPNGAGLNTRNQTQLIECSVYKDTTNSNIWVYNPALTAGSRWVLELPISSIYTADGSTVTDLDVTVTDSATFRLPVNGPAINFRNSGRSDAYGNIIDVTDINNTGKPSLSVTTVPLASNGTTGFGGQTLQGIQSYVENTDVTVPFANIQAIGAYTYSYEPAITSGAVQGIISEVQILAPSGGNIIDANGYSSYVNNTGSTDISTLSGLFSTIRHNGSGTISELSVLRSQEVTNSGPVTNKYNLKLSDWTGFGSTKNRSIESMTRAPSYFKGGIHLNTESFISQDTFAVSGPSRFVGKITAQSYGTGAMTAAALGKTISPYVAGIATDGTIIDVPNATTTTSVSDSTAFRAFTATATDYVIMTDSLRGGKFRRCYTCTADQYMVFTDALSRKWERFDYVDIVPEFYGASASFSNNRYYIQRALNLNSTITLKPNRIYKISGMLMLNTGNIINGAGSTIRQLLDGDNALKITSAQRVQIKNLKLRGTFVNQYAILAGGGFGAPDNNGICIESSSEILIENCLFERFVGSGVYASTAKKITIKDCTAIGNHYSGTTSADYNLYVDVSDIQILNTKAYSNNSAGFAIGLNGEFDNVLIDGCLSVPKDTNYVDLSITSVNRRQGIIAGYGDGGNTASQKNHIKVVNSTFLNSGAAGMYINYCQSTLTGNVVRVAGFHSVTFHNPSIINGQSLKGGIVVVDPTQSIVSGNLVQDIRDGGAEVGDSVQISGIKFLVDTPTPNLRVNNSSMVISNNTVTNISGQGVLIGTTFNQVYINSNNISDCRGYGLSLLHEDSNNENNTDIFTTNINDNFIENTVSGGVYLTAYATEKLDVYIKNNEFVTILANKKGFRNYTGGAAGSVKLNFTGNKWDGFENVYYNQVRQYYRGNDITLKNEQYNNITASIYHAEISESTDSVGVICDGCISNNSTSLNTFSNKPAVLFGTVNGQKKSAIGTATFDFNTSYNRPVYGTWRVGDEFTSVSNIKYLCTTAGIGGASGASVWVAISITDSQNLSVSGDSLRISTGTDVALADINYWTKTGAANVTRTSGKVGINVASANMDLATSNTLEVQGSVAIGTPFFGGQYNAPTNGLSVYGNVWMGVHTGALPITMFDYYTGFTKPSANVLEFYNNYELQTTYDVLNRFVDYYRSSPRISNTNGRGFEMRMITSNPSYIRLSNDSYSGISGDGGITNNHYIDKGTDAMIQDDPTLLSSSLLLNRDGGVKVYSFDAGNQVNSNPDRVLFALDNTGKLGLSNADARTPTQRIDLFNGTMRFRDFSTANNVLIHDATGVVASVTPATIVTNGGGITTVGAFQTAGTANGLSLSGTDIRLHSANGTQPGAVDLQTDQILGDNPKILQHNSNAVSTPVKILNTLADANGEGSEWGTYLGAGVGTKVGTFFSSITGGSVAGGTMTGISNRGSDNTLRNSVLINSENTFSNQAFTNRRTQNVGASYDVTSSLNNRAGSYNFETAGGVLTLPDPSTLPVGDEINYSLTYGFGGTAEINTASATPEFWVEGATSAVTSVFLPLGVKSGILTVLDISGTKYWHQKTNTPESTTIGTFQTASTANGLSLSGTDIRLHSASGTNAGAVDLTDGQLMGSNTKIFQENTASVVTVPIIARNTSATGDDGGTKISLQLGGSFVETASFENYITGGSIAGGTESAISSRNSDNVLRSNMVIQSDNTTLFNGFVAGKTQTVGSSFSAINPGNRAGLFHFEDDLGILTIPTASSVVNGAYFDFIVDVGDNDAVVALVSQTPAAGEFRFADSDIPYDDLGFTNGQYGRVTLHNSVWTVMLHSPDAVYTAASATYTVGERVRILDVPTGASTTTINLPEIVANPITAGQVKIGYTIDISIARAASVTINRAGSSDVFYVNGGTSTSTSITTTGGTYYVKRFIAAGVNKWVVQ